MVHRGGLDNTPDKNKNNDINNISRLSTDEKPADPNISEDSIGITATEIKQTKRSLRKGIPNETSLPLSDHSISQSVVRAERRKYIKRKNQSSTNTENVEQSESVSPVRPGLRSSSLESHTSTTSNSNNAKAKRRKLIGRKKKSNLSQDLCTSSCNEAQNLSMALSPQEQSFSVMCSLPLERLSGILENLNIDRTCWLNSEENKPAEDRLNSEQPSSQCKVLCLYCDKRMSSIKVRARHIERFHTISKDRRSSTRNPIAFSQESKDTSGSQLSSASSAISSTPKPPSCPLINGCSYCFKSPKLQVVAVENDLNALFYHLVDYHSDKYFGCKLCAIRFQNVSKLDEHIQHMHTQSEKTPQSIGEINSATDLDDDQNTPTKVHQQSKQHSLDRTTSTSNQESPSPNKTGSSSSSSRNESLSFVSTEETFLSRLGITQNRLPRGRKGIRSRRQTAIDVGKTDTTPGSVKTRSKVGRVCTSNEPIENVFRAPTNVRTEPLSSTFDDDFYEKVLTNVRTNLICHLDGKLSTESDGRRPQSPPLIMPAIRSTVVKSPHIVDSEVHTATSLSSLTAFPTLLTAEQYGCDLGTNKIKRPITKHSWKWKWDRVKKYKYVNEGGKIVKKIKQPMLGLRDLSKLDMWTQLTMRQKHELSRKNLEESNGSTDIVEFAETIRDEKQKQIDQLNSILDSRRLPQIILEQNEQTIIKLEVTEEGLRFMASQIGMRSPSFQTTSGDRDQFADRILPANLDLIPRSSLNESLRHAVVLSGEWARPRCYVCFGCGARFDKLKSLEEHKMFRHPHVYSTHYEIVGRELIEGNLYKHFFIPLKALNRHKEYVQETVLNKKTEDNVSKVSSTSGNDEESLDSLHSVTASFTTFNSSKLSDDGDTDTKNTVENSTSSLVCPETSATAPNTENRLVPVNAWSVDCTKCKRNCHGMLDLYRHMLDCSGDYAWLLAKKKKYRYYGSRKRRQFNRQTLSAMHLHKRKLKASKEENDTDETPKKKLTASPPTPRPRPSDADSIRKMLENLPAKRICREIIPNATKPRPRKFKTKPGIPSKNVLNSKPSKTMLTALSKKFLRNHKLRGISEKDKIVRTTKILESKRKSTRVKNFTAPKNACDQLEKLNEKADSKNSGIVNKIGASTKRFVKKIRKRLLGETNATNENQRENITEKKCIKTSAARKLTFDKEQDTNKVKQISENQSSITNGIDGNTSDTKVNSKDSGKTQKTATAKEGKKEVLDEASIPAVIPLNDKFLSTSTETNQNQENKVEPETASNTEESLKSPPGPIQSQVSPTTKRRSKKINDCIAMLTGKIQEKLGKPFLECKDTKNEEASKISAPTTEPSPVLSTVTTESSDVKITKRKAVTRKIVKCDSLKGSVGDLSTESLNEEPVKAVISPDKLPISNKSLNSTTEPIVTVTAMNAAHKECSPNVSIITEPIVTVTAISGPPKLDLSSLGTTLTKLPSGTNSPFALHQSNEPQSQLILSKPSSSTTTSSSLSNITTTVAPITFPNLDKYIPSAIKNAIPPSITLELVNSPKPKEVPKKTSVNIKPSLTPTQYNMNADTIRVPCIRPSRLTVPQFNPVELTTPKAISRRRQTITGAPNDLFSSPPTLNCTNKHNEIPFELEVPLDLSKKSKRCSPKAKTNSKTSILPLPQISVKPNAVLMPPIQFPLPLLPQSQILPILCESLISKIPELPLRSPPLIFPPDALKPIPSTPRKKATSNKKYEVEVSPVNSQGLPEQTSNRPVPKLNSKEVIIPQKEKLPDQMDVAIDPLKISSIKFSLSPHDQNSCHGSKTSLIKVNKKSNSEPDAVDKQPAAKENLPQTILSNQRDQNASLEKPTLKNGEVSENSESSKENNSVSSAPMPLGEISAGNVNGVAQPSQDVTSLEHIPTKISKQLSEALPKKNSSNLSPSDSEYSTNPHNPLESQCPMDSVKLSDNVNLDEVKGSTENVNPPDSACPPAIVSAPIEKCAQENSCSTNNNSMEIPTKPHKATNSPTNIDPPAMTSNSETKCPPKTASTSKNLGSSKTANSKAANSATKNPSKTLISSETKCTPKTKTPSETKGLSKTRSASKTTSPSQTVSSPKVEKPTNPEVPSVADQMPVPINSNKSTPSRRSKRNKASDQVEETSIISTKTSIQKKPTDLTSEPATGKEVSTSSPLLTPAVDNSNPQLMTPQTPLAMSESKEPDTTIPNMEPLSKSEVDKKSTTSVSDANSVSDNKDSNNAQDVNKKPRKRRKNELAAIVADQLLESFKEVDKSRLDDLKKLENLAYEKSEDLLLTGMRLMPTTKRKNTLENKKDSTADHDSKQLATLKEAQKKHKTETPKEKTPKIPKDFKDPPAVTRTEPKSKHFKEEKDTIKVPLAVGKSDIKTKPLISMDFGNYRTNSVDSWSHRLHDLPIFTPENNKSPLSEVGTSGHKKCKKKQSKKREKKTELENINELRTGLESFTLSKNVLNKGKNEVPVIPRLPDPPVILGGLFTHVPHNPTSLIPRKEPDLHIFPPITNSKPQSSILRPSILAATLDAATNKENPVQNHDRKSIVSSRDPRLNKNIHQDDGERTDVNVEISPRLATLRQRRKSLADVNISTPTSRANSRTTPKKRSEAVSRRNSLTFDDDEDDNYLTAIAKRVNDQIMSAEDKDFNLANDGFDLANSFLGLNGQFERPPTSMSVRSAPNFNDDRSNMDTMDATNTDLIDMDVDDDMSIYTTFSQDTSRSKGRRRRRRRSILLTRKPKKTNINFDQPAESFNCTLCNKSFAKLAALNKHQLTIAHVTKVSEQEYLNAAKNQNNNDQVSEATILPQEPTPALTAESRPPTPKCPIISLSPRCAFNNFQITSPQSRILHSPKLFDTDDKPQEKSHKQLQPKLPYIPMNSILNLAGIEPISSPEQNYDRFPTNTSSRLTLNPDERLFYECCNILKGSETPLVERSYPIVPPTPYIYDMHVKPVTPKSTHERYSLIKQSEDDVGGRQEIGSTYPSIDVNQFSDISSDSNPVSTQPPRILSATYTQMHQMPNAKTHLASLHNEDASDVHQLRNDIHLVPSKHGIVSMRSPDAVLPMAARTFVNPPAHIVALTTGTESPAIAAQKQTFTSPLHSTSSQSSTVTTATNRLKTKAAMKGYDNLKVSILTAGLDMEHALERSPRPGCKLTTLAEIALGNETPMSTLTSFTPVMQMNNEHKSKIKSQQSEHTERYSGILCPSKFTEISLQRHEKKLSAIQRSPITLNDSQSCMPIVLDSPRKTDILNHKDIYEFDDSENTPMSKAIQSQFKNSENNDSAKKPIIIPERPFKNIGLEEKEPIKFQKPEMVTINDENSNSTISYSDRDDYVYGSISGGDDENENENENENDNKDNIPESDESNGSSAFTVKTSDNKSLIVGRIFKNAKTKQKQVTEKPKIPTPEPPKQIPKQELDRLFDTLRGLKENQLADAPSEEKLQSPTNSAESKDPSVAKKRLPGKKAKAKKNDGVSSTKSSKKARNKDECYSKEMTKLHTELGMSPGEIEDLMGERQRKSQRRCAVNRPKKLVEIWSSDEFEEFLATKDVIALIEEKEQKTKKKKKTTASSGKKANSAQVSVENTAHTNPDKTSSTQQQLEKNNPLISSQESEPVRKGTKAAQPLSNKTVKKSKAKTSKKTTAITPPKAKAAKKIKSASVSRRNSTENVKNNKNATKKTSQRRTSSKALNDSESDFEAELNRKSRAKPISSRRKTVCGKLEHTASDQSIVSKKSAATSAPQQSRVPINAKTPSTENQVRAQARRKRIASEMLYYWSSSSDEDFGRIESTHEDDDHIQHPEHYQQHGWIVGDSHKKLVTLLAIAKGSKKVDNCRVKETTTSSHKKKT